MGKTTAHSSPSWKARLRAWWDGAPMADDEPPPAVETAPAAEAERSPPPDLAPARGGLRKRGWPLTRIELVQFLFGAGMNGPGASLHEDMIA
jgi:hypothetical protein